MTMVDEQTLRDALKASADEFEISQGAVTRILDEASAEEPGKTSRSITSLIPQSKKVRVLSFSVAALILASAIAVPLMRSETPAPKIVGSAFSQPGATGLVVTGGSQYSLTPPTANSKRVTLSSSGSVGKGVATKIESNGYVNLTVGIGNVTSSMKRLTMLVQGDHGFVESSNAQLGSQARSSSATGTIVLEVPQSTFTLLVAQVQGIGHVTSVNTSSTNVTTQYVNLQSRITALNVSLRQYFAIMTRATTITAILAVQNQINNIQNQIQQNEGQLKTLNNLTTYSDLTVYLSATGHHAAAGPRTGFKKAWHDSVSGFVAGFQWLIRLAGPLLFALVLLAALYALARFTRRALLRRKLQ
jgi:uncharacterized protein DUF4349